MAVGELGWQHVGCADEKANEEAFGLPEPVAARVPIHNPFVSLVENGTHVLFGSQIGGYATGEITLARPFCRA